jgi:hypothetical protein
VVSQWGNKNNPISSKKPTGYLNPFNFLGEDDDAEIQKRDNGGLNREKWQKVDKLILYKYMISLIKKYISPQFWKYSIF